MQADAEACTDIEEQEVVLLEDSPDSSRDYEGDISVSESYGSVALSEALGNRRDRDSLNCSRASEQTDRSLVKSSIPSSSAKQQLPSLRQQVELIRARGRIIQLESELDTERRGTKRARITQDIGHVTMTTEEEERLHELERDRCRLLDDLVTVKAKLEETKNEVVEKTDALTTVFKENESEKQKLHSQISELRSQLNIYEVSVHELKTELTDLKLKHSSQEISEIESIRDTHSKSLESLQRRLEDVSKVERSLQTSEEKCKELERQLRSTRQDGYFVETVKEKLMQFDELQRRCNQLSEENVVFSQSQTNGHLLRYKVQVLQDRCERLEALEEEVARLTLENDDLQKALAAGQEEVGASVTVSSPGVAVLRYRIAHLQSNERILVRRRGELETIQHVAEKEATLAKEALEEARRLLALEQERSKVKDERIQRLEKRLLFVTKEREGCINVLNSYRKDSGVDALLRVNLTELEEQVKRGEKRISELEAELEQVKGQATVIII